MTRINIIPPAELCDQHLLAEHRELTRIPNLVAKGKFSLEGQPSDYKLGTGHVKFFFDKMQFLFERYNSLHEECLARGFNVKNIWPENLTKDEFFWKNYKRPPLKEYQEYIIQRRDLIVPQDIRERKGAYFTPRIWVEKSQEYMAEYFGENYQDEYYIWDCAAGTGNLLAGLTNKYNIYASTLDMADVQVMRDMAEHKTANLLKDHIFQFDFLNDDFSQLPQSLQDIINDPEKRKKLILYINPPYAEATNAKTVTRT